MSFDLSGATGGVPNKALIPIVVGAAGYFWWRNRQSAAAPVSTDPTASDASVMDASGTGAVGGYTDNTTPAPTAPTISDNNSWGIAATNYLIAKGYDPAVSDSAVRKYLASAPLSMTEYALIKVALLQFGPPPEGISTLPAPAPQIPTQAPKPVTPPKKPAPAPKPVSRPTAVYYTVVPGDSLSRIAARYPDPNITWQSIYALNRGQIRDPDVIYPGQRLRIK